MTPPLPAPATTVAAPAKQPAYWYPRWLRRPGPGWLALRVLAFPFVVAFYTVAGLLWVLVKIAPIMGMAS